MDRTLLPAVAAFAEVAATKSFTKAAVRLGVSPSALSQTIRALEDRLAVRLLNRSTRSVSPTEAGRLFLERAAPGLAMIAEAAQVAGEARERPTGEVRINTSRLAARLFVEPHVGEFRRRFPDVRLEIVIDEGFGDIVREGCDAGIRLRERVVESMIAVPISAPMRMAVVASPTYLATRSAPETPFDLVRHDCIGYRPRDGGGLYRWDFTDPADGHAFTIEPVGGYVTGDDEAMVSAALQGAGLAMHMEVAVARPLATGALVRVLDDWCPPFDGFDLYLPSRDHMPAKLRALVDFLVEKRGR